MTYMTKKIRLLILLDIKKIQPFTSLYSCGGEVVIEICFILNSNSISRLLRSATFQFRMEWQ